MILYLKIDKIDENDKSVTYRFVESLSNSEPGIISISKDTKDIDIIKELDNDPDHKLVGYAYIAVIKEFRRNGCFPEHACWAS